MALADEPTDFPVGGTPRRHARFSELFELIAENVGEVIQGKRDTIELCLIGMLAEGHILIEDVPGVGKTSLARALAASIDGVAGRVQFTPDLLPSDVIGVTIWNRSTGAFEFRKGPVFANLLLGDEINRASPKTQSALLEAMEERQVTVDGVTHPLARPFMVLATENPHDHEGTYPLPESQLDRFLLRLSIGYPDRDAELTMLDVHGEVDQLAKLNPVVTGTEVAAMIDAVRHVHVAAAVREYLVNLAHASRNHRGIEVGMSPRATLALQRASRARAAMLGRNYVIPDDVKAMAVPVLSHRLQLSVEAQLQALDQPAIVAELLQAVPVPSARSAG